ncbi:TadE/TadG family type IV pilus assembly protein [Nocardioides abyssi]|uniref:Pilus assembly protein n=1 Tax=Nocardioides abyssi TaxID=3058370 RepID=A0ABT8ER40_9ACTN|nr:TadE/TadG family type IV pilus assembly protein [Nocardioides abyssi]MDN4160620.1 pilus assembly protein [Nocardioides abyssi]
MSSRRHRERRGKEGGAAAVEFALLLPLLLLLVFGIVQYGLYFWTLQGGSDIARDAARLSAVGTPDKCLTFRSAVRAQVESLNGAGEVATITRTYVDASPNGINVGDTVRVRVEFPAADLQLPFLPFVNGGLVATTAEARVEYVPVAPEPCA